MSFFESLLISAFGLGMVFVVLIALSAVISAETKILNVFKFKKPAEADNKKAEAAPAEVAANTTAGELKLIGVNDRTAAIIMAIVSDETGIPLSELKFKRIRALN